jgi:hypothetical protein
MQKPQPRGWGFRFGGKPTSRHRLIAGRVEERRPAMRLPAIERSPEFIRGDVISRRTQPVHHSASQSGPAVRARIPDNCPRLHRHRSKQLGRTVHCPAHSTPSSKAISISNASANIRSAASTTQSRSPRQRSSTERQVEPWLAVRTGVCAILTDHLTTRRCCSHYVLVCENPL